MAFTKIFGWLLLLAGLATIGYCLYSSYNIFTGEKSAPEIFGVPKQEEQVKTPSALKTLEDLPTQMEKMLGEQLKMLLPFDALPKMLNLGSWSIFAGILIFAGSKIAGLGIGLIRKG